MDNVDYTFNENGIPCCLHAPTLPMKREGSKSHLKSKIPTMKFVCPKMKWEYNPTDRSKRRVCHCDNPCTTSSCGRIIYIYPEKNLRAYPGVERGSKEWNETYRIRIMLKNPSTISKIVFVLLIAKPYTQICFWLELRSC